MSVSAFVEWAKRSKSRINERGYDGAKESVHEIYSACWRGIGWHVPRGKNIFKSEWDVLVVLDACRVDLINEVTDEYPYLKSPDVVRSVGSMSEEWMTKTFTDRYHSEIAGTAYITSNVFSKEVLHEDSFYILDELWRYCWDDELGTVPPSVVTDRAINIARKQNPDRMIIHYMQPHHPFIGSEIFGQFGIDQFGSENRETIIDSLRKGGISRNHFWRAYKENLRCVLDSLNVLFSNLDADTVVITSDHGEALGEWGIYGHPAGCLHPAVMNVPWVETSATDTREYQPDTESFKDETANVRGILRDLGYL